MLRYYLEREVNGVTVVRYETSDPWQVERLRGDDRKWWLVRVEDVQPCLMCGGAGSDA